MDKNAFLNYLATGISTDEIPMTDLQRHDAKYHPNGFKEGDSCKYRENLAKKDKADADILNSPKSGKEAAATEEFNKRMDDEQKAHRPELPEQVKKWDSEWRAKKRRQELMNKYKDAVSKTEPGNADSEPMPPDDPSNKPHSPNKNQDFNQYKKDWYKKFSERPRQVTPPVEINANDLTKKPTSIPKAPPR